MRHDMTATCVSYIPGNASFAKPFFRVWVRYIMQPSHKYHALPMPPAALDFAISCYDLAHTIVNGFKDTFLSLPPLFHFVPYFQTNP